jgi:diguanylate cyclase (GGDEF)-like protein
VLLRGPWKIIETTNREISAVCLKTNMLDAGGINPLEQETVDIGRVIEYRDFISSLTSLDFSIYDGAGRLLAPMISEDPVIRVFVSSQRGGREQQEFVQRSIEKAAVRRGISLFKGPLNQYHCFIPVRADHVSLVLVGNAFYASAEDLEELESRCTSYGLSRQDLMAWAKGVVLSELREISEECEIIHKLLSISVSDAYEKRLNAERSRKARIIVDLLSEIEDDMDECRLSALLVDTVIFLFGGETVSVTMRKADKFVPALTKGRLKAKVESLVSGYCDPPVSDLMQGRGPVAIVEPSELLRLGYPTDVTSLQVFPIAARDELLGFLSVFNSTLSEDDVNNISRLCALVGLLEKNLRSQKAHEKHMSDISALNLATADMASCKDPDRLCESIVEISSSLMNTERASLMLPEKEHDELFIRGVKGINKWIAKNIRVRIGEGIAGKVYKEKEPIMVTDIEKTLSTQKKPNYRTGSFVSIPLKIGDEAIGVLNLADKIDGEVFSEEDMTFLRHFASCASIALQGAQYCRALEEMRTLSITDCLTGLFNRRYFDDRLFEELQRALRYDSPFSLAIFDIDDFKLFNDTEGHLAGDEVLKAIADISRESVRSIDIVARFGGEEFAVIMPQTEKEEAFLVAERTRKNIKDLMPLHWENFPRKEITVSIGIATFPSEGRDAKTLTGNADKALYRAKVGGKDRTVVWDASR